MPWVACTLKETYNSELYELFPMSGFPTAGVIDGETGNLICDDYWN